VKIILVNPPARQREYQRIVVPPLGLLYVATHLKNAGYDVRIKDALRKEWIGMLMQNILKVKNRTS
jgi:hypothetical protein